jgi:hypothetical protein
LPTPPFWLATARTLRPGLKLFVPVTGLSLR